MKNHTKKSIDIAMLEEIFNHLYTNVYITDIETDQIVYMNNTMKKTFGLKNPEGCTCWEVLQHGMKERCHFCKINTLLTDKDKMVSVWNEENTATNKIYKNYDSLFEWEGKMYHIQHSIDVTKQIRFSETAILDELTGLYNRRAGKERLRQTIEKGKKEQKTLVAALYDVNDLKSVNDRYGHTEGDALLIHVATAAKSVLRGDDFGFRLGGDEFLLCFYDATVEEAARRVKDTLEQLQTIKERLKLPYSLSYSYGLVGVYPKEQRLVADVIAKADERMYIQKRDYHIRRAKGIVSAKEYNEGKEKLEYNKDDFYAALEQSTDDYIFVGDMKTGVFQYSQAMVEEFNLPGQVVEDAAIVLGALVHPEDEAVFLEGNQEIADGRADYHNIEYRAENVRGEWVWLRCKGKLIKDREGFPDIFAGFISNIGIESRLDYLTGIYNRFEFEGNIKKNLVNREVHNMGIMILNMDGFHNINDLYNHSFGDAVLKKTSKKLLELIPSNAKLFRMDGDEFGILISNTNETQCRSIYGDIQREFEIQQEYEGRKYFCTMSAGYTVYPQDGDNFLDLMKYANYSLEQSKKAGKNRLTVFTRHILRDKEQRLELTEKLRESIRRGFVGFYVCYQPQVVAGSGQLYGAEVLARWACDEYGVVPPGTFIPILEECGLIGKLGHWVFERALEQCGKWLTIWPDFHMSINLSYQELMEKDLLLFFEKALKKSKVNPSAITLELTETYLVKEDKVAKKIMEGIQHLGMQTAMDDFGTGYSSLYVLKNIPVNVVKIDREFSKGICNDAFDVTFIKAITDLCNNAGKVVCLEGIETKEQYEIIKENADLGLIQGYYFGRPVKALEFETQFGK